MQQLSVLNRGDRHQQPPTAAKNWQVKQAKNADIVNQVITPLPLKLLGCPLVSNEIYASTVHHVHQETIRRSQKLAIYGTALLRYGENHEILPKSHLPDHMVRGSQRLGGRIRTDPRKR